MLQLTPINESHTTLLESWHHDTEFKQRVGGYDSIPDFINYITTDPTRRMWIASEGDKPIGMFDVELNEDHSAWIALAVEPKLRGQGYGRKILQVALSHTDLSSVTQFKATVEPDNNAAKALFKGEGFRSSGEIDEEGFLLYFKEEGFE
jgi:RimJ/RimL family protein N-acetyltransferase